MRNILVVLFPAALMLTGCGDLLSLHALHTPQNQVFDPALEGRWENKDDLLSVVRSGQAYEVKLTNRLQPPTTAKYEVHFVDLRGVRFADLLPEDRIGHMILRVRTVNRELHLAFMDTEWLRQHVPHELADIENNRTQAVLTLKTPQLQRMVQRFALEPRAFDKEIVFLPSR